MGDEVGLIVGVVEGDAVGLNVPQTRSLLGDARTTSRNPFAAEHAVRFVHFLSDVSVGALT